MKKLLTILLTLALVLGLCACGGAGGGKDGLQAGFSRKSIIPETQVHLDGSTVEGRPAGDAIDDITASCIAISNGKDTILLYTMDLVFIQSETYKAQNYVSEATGISVDNIIMSGTHTHSAPAVNYKSAADYRQQLYDTCTALAQEAIADMSAAEIYFGSAETEGLCYVRHYITADGENYGTHQSVKRMGAILEKHAYEANKTMQVIKFARAAEDKQDIVLMNLGAHPNYVSQNATRLNISADWPGYARTYVEENTDALCAFFLSAAGDQQGSSSVYKSNHDGIKGYINLGNDAGKACVDILNGEMTKAEGTKIQVTIKDFEAASNKENIDNADLIAEAQSIMELSETADTITLQNAIIKSSFESYYHAKSQIERAKAPATRRMQIQALTAGGISMIFAPFEMFGEQSKYITDNSPYGMTFIVTCSENPIGGPMRYMSNINGMDNNYYEGIQMQFERGTAEKLAEIYVDMLTGLKGEG